ncbi:TPA: permease, partial [Streptococcus equi subsp. zooepidemicus]|nr:permease [Streptococcus equi subsp. zooepidemicus]
MNLLVNNRFFRYTSISTFLNQFGSSIYNIVFIIYVASTYHSKTLVSIANIILMIPILFQLLIGQYADRIRNRAKWLIWGGISQSILFMIIAYLTNQKSYLVFSIICLINIISDCISNLLSGISMPIFKHHIPQDELMTAYSLRNIISFICGIGGQTFGIWLLEISNKNFGFVAIINAFSFLISSIILVSIKSLLINNKEKITRHSFSRNFLEMYDASKGIFSTKSDSQFIKLITTVIISNVLGSAIIPIFNLYFLENKWQNFSYGQTLLILNTTMILGNILGSLFPKDFFSRLSLKKILALELYSFALIGIFSFLKFPFIFVLFVFSFNCFLVGKFNPKFSATLMTNVPDNMLAQVSSFISFLVMISIPIGTSVFS